MFVVGTVNWTIVKDNLVAVMNGFYEKENVMEGADRIMYGV